MLNTTGIFLGGGHSLWSLAVLDSQPKKVDKESQDIWVSSLFKLKIYIIYVHVLGSSTFCIYTDFAVAVPEFKLRKMLQATTVCNLLPPFGHKS